MTTIQPACPGQQVEKVEEDAQILLDTAAPEADRMAAFARVLGPCRNQPAVFPLVPDGFREVF
jgi:hypothetical protein